MPKQEREPQSSESEENVGKEMSLEEVNKFLSENPNIKEEILGENLKEIKKNRGGYHILTKEQMEMIFEKMGCSGAKLKDEKVAFWDNNGLQVRDAKWADSNEKDR